mmetsp:Transcript_14058/g.37987  ORF Transcript_14058/g.37987 Transcript_14058/m.37987 type:complete len:237 (-) Transcript_14058:2976-3686(-)
MRSRYAALTMSFQPAPGILSFTGCSRALICLQASKIAPPYMSEDALAAVGEELGTLSVEVSLMKTLDRGVPRACAATWAILVCRPWPISTPPCVTSTVPSKYTCTSAPAWFKNLVVKEMPNLVGVMAMPRLRQRLLLLYASTCARRVSYCELRMACSQHGPTRQCSIACPKCVMSPSLYMLSCRTSWSGLPTTLAICSTHISANIAPWGPPKPRKAVLEAWLVLHSLPTTRTLGML